MENSVFQFFSLKFLFQWLNLVYKICFSGVNGVYDALFHEKCSSAKARISSFCLFHSVVHVNPILLYCFILAMVNNFSLKLLIIVYM